MEGNITNTMTEEELKKYTNKVDPKFYLNGKGLVPMRHDISWFTWYGFLLLIGFKKERDLTGIAISSTKNLMWVKDVHTERHFIRNVHEGRLVQFTQDDLWNWEWKKL